MIKEFSSSLVERCVERGKLLSGCGGQCQTLDLALALGIPPAKETVMPQRAVLIVREDQGKWLVQFRICASAVDQMAPVRGAGDVNAVDGWLASGWRIVNGAGHEGNRVVLTLEHAPSE